MPHTDATVNAVAEYAALHKFDAESVDRINVYDAIDHVLRIEHRGQDVWLAEEFCKQILHLNRFNHYLKGMTQDEKVFINHEGNSAIVRKRAFLTLAGIKTLIQLPRKKKISKWIGDYFDMFTGIKICPLTHCTLEGMLELFLGYYFRVDIIQAFRKKYICIGERGEVLYGSITSDDKRYLQGILAAQLNNFCDTDEWRAQRAYFKN